MEEERRNPIPSPRPLKLKGRVGYIAGAWDLFHVGHLRVLQKAKEFVDVLIVGVNTDEYVASYKRRPVIPYDQRREILLGLRCVDVAVPHVGFEDTFPLEEMGVEVRFVGEEYGKYEGEGRHLEELSRRGIAVTRLPRTPDISAILIRQRCAISYPVTIL